MKSITQAEILPNTRPMAISENCVRTGATHLWTKGKLAEGAIEPPIRIYTLGRFSVAVDRRQICAESKGKQRPLALLKALIALGGRDIAANQVWECLWPDSEGDLGCRNLTITLHRLRHMLPTQAAVLQHGGKLTLNDEICWVDAWDFERMVNDGLVCLDQPAIGDAAEFYLRTALTLYAGDFLARESEEFWMLAPRLRLKTKLERLVSTLSINLEHQGRFSEAIDLCLQALGLDPLNESLYRRLMSCYLKRGEFASALGTYLRCCEALTKGLSAPISRETERLHLEALHAANIDIAQRVTLPPGLIVRSQALQKSSAA